MRRARRTTRIGFTLVEMLAVISIIAIASAIMVPAFSRLVESVNFSSGVNTVTSVLGSARSLAIQQKRHTAVLFLFDTKTESMTLEILEEYQASLDPNTGAPYFAFAPAFGRTPVKLPIGVGLYGLPKPPRPRCDSGEASPDGYAGRVDCAPFDSGFIPGWYENCYAGVGTGTSSDDLPLWIFPHNDARMFMPNDPPEDRYTGVDPWAVLTGVSGAATEDEAKRAVRSAQTFAVVFSPEGRVVDAPVSGTQSFDLMYREYPNDPADRCLSQNDTDYGSAYDWGDNFDPDQLGAGGPLGASVSPDCRTPNREVMFRTVEQLAIVDLKRLADALGVARPWYIRPEESGAEQPEWQVEAGYFTADGVSAPHRKASAWIDDNAEIVSFSRYSGEVLRRAAQ